MKNLQLAFNRLTKKTKFAIVALIATAILAVPAVVFAGYGPNGSDRVIFDWKKIEDRPGASDAPRFNSFINTDVYGDERAFVDSKECVVNGPECYQQGVEGGYKDQQPVTPGKEYIIRAYVHNNANTALNDNTETSKPNDGIGIAENTRIRFELPAGDGLANGFTAQARITAKNSIPTQVYDTVDLINNEERFGLEYIPGSAYIFNASHPNGLNLSDEIMGADGTLIGDDEMDGLYPGCFEYSSFVVIRVKTTQPDITIEKFAATVEKPKMTDVSETVTINRGETVSWRINYKNSGSHWVDDLTVRDELPEGLEIVPGSIILNTAAGEEVLPDTALGSGGVNVGDYIPEGNGVIRFSTVVNTDPEVCELTNIAFARSNNVKEVSDTAKVVIRDCEKPKEPLYACTNLGVVLVKDNTYKFTVNTKAENGATVKHYVINYGDGTGEVVTTESSSTHTYNKAGTYVSSADVVFNVGNNMVEDKDNPDCVAKVSFDTKGVVTPPTTTLPNTGAGSVAGLMAAVTAAGMFIYRKLALRSNQ